MSQASWGLSIAFSFVAVVMIGFGLGRLIDGWLDSEPWAQVVGTIVGWVIGVYVVYHASQVQRD